MSDRSNFIEGMRLSPDEISALDRYVGIIEQATKNRVEFSNSGQVAFTPGALLVVAVAEFAYRVYRDYGQVALTPEDLQVHFKSVARELAELEAGVEESAGLDAFARLRKQLVAAKKASH